jgi:iron complex outermembrane receptor protein
MGLDARNKPGSNDASTVRQLENDSPAHQAFLHSAFNLPGGFEADLMWRYVSGIPNQQVPAYQTGDIRVSRRIGSEFDLAVVGRNLLQPSHVEYGGNPGGLVRIRRSAYLKLTWTR